MARTPQSTLTCTMRSSEHAAHRLLMHSVHTSHLWLKVSPCVSFHIIHACALVSCLLSGLSSPVSLLPHPVPLPALPDVHPAPDEISIEDPLCNSSLGSMVTLDHVTPLTKRHSTLLGHHECCFQEATIREKRQQLEALEATCGRTRASEPR